MLPSVQLNLSGPPFPMGWYRVWLWHSRKFEQLCLIGVDTFGKSKHKGRIPTASLLLVLQFYFLHGKAWAFIVKWSVMLLTILYCPEVQIYYLHRGRCSADGPGVLAWMHLWQHLTCFYRLHLRPKNNAVLLDATSFPALDVQQHHECHVMHSLWDYQVEHTGVTYLYWWGPW